MIYPTQYAGPGRRAAVEDAEYREFQLEVAQVLDNAAAITPPVWAQIKSSIASRFGPLWVGDESKLWLWHFIVGDCSIPQSAIDKLTVFLLGVEPTAVTVDRDKLDKESV